MTDPNIWALVSADSSPTDFTLEVPLMGSRRCRASGTSRLKSLIVAPGFIPKLPPAVRQARLRLLMKLENDYLNPLKLSHYVETEEDKQALSGLVQSGKVIMLNSENAMLLRAYNEAKERIILYLNSVDSATVSQLKEALGGTGRRIMVPLCERLDREGITRRHGDMRSLAKPSKSK